MCHMVFLLSNTLEYLNSQIHINSILEARFEYSKRSFGYLKPVLIKFGCLFTEKIRGVFIKVYGYISIFFCHFCEGGQLL